MIEVVGACNRELAALPEVIRGDLADALARLDTGLALSMPLSRPMPDIGKGVHEMRLRDRGWDVSSLLFRQDTGNNLRAPLHAEKDSGNAGSNDQARSASPEGGQINHDEDY